MASEDRGCCDKCAKTFIMAINVVIILIGGAILAAGIYWQTSETGFYKEIFNHDIFNVPIISIIVGALLLVIGLCGFIGSCCEILFLLKAYMGMIIIIMLVEIVLAVGCVAMKTTVEEYATNRTMDMIGYYDVADKDEHGLIKATLDAVQKNFDCCGVNGPEDWASNVAYETNQFVPNSCCIEAKRVDAACGDKSYHSNAEINKTGCKASLWNFIDTNLLYVGIVAGVIVIVQIAVLIMVSKLRTTVEDESYDYL